MLRCFIIICLLGQAGWAWASQEAEDKAQRHFRAGLEMLAKGHFKDAKAELGVAKALSPQRQDILDALAAADGSPAPASKAEAVQPAPESGLAAAPLAEAREAYRASEVAKAKDSWNRA